MACHHVRLPGGAGTAIVCSKEKRAPPCSACAGELADARAMGGEAVRRGRCRAANPYAFVRDASTRARTPVDARGRPYRADLDDAWDGGWLAAAPPYGPLPKVPAGPLPRVGCWRGHSAIRLQKCPTCGVEYCDGPGHAHVCINTKTNNRSEA